MTDNKFIAENLVKSLVKGVIFALISSLLLSLAVTVLLYFEVVGTSVASKILYVAFIVILFLATFIIARKIGSKGLYLGLGIGCIIILIGALYRFIGVETGVGLTFLIRSAIVLLVATGSAVMGVNTVK